MCTRTSSSSTVYTAVLVRYTAQSSLTSGKPTSTSLLRQVRRELIEFLWLEWLECRWQSASTQRAQRARSNGSSRAPLANDGLGNSRPRLRHTASVFTVHRYEEGGRVHLRCHLCVTVSTPSASRWHHTVYRMQSRLRWGSRRPSALSKTKSQLLGDWKIHHPPTERGVPQHAAKSWARQR